MKSLGGIGLLERNERLAENLASARALGAAESPLEGFLLRTQATSGHKSVRPRLSWCAADAGADRCSPLTAVQRLVISDDSNDQFLSIG